MLNPFPTMWLSLLAYFVLRILIGSTLLFLGYRHLQKKSELADAFSQWISIAPQLTALMFAVGEIVIAVAIIIGYGTQYAALAGMLMCIKMLMFRSRFKTDLLPTRLYYVVLLGAFMSLFITGAGAFAHDLPL